MGSRAFERDVTGTGRPTVGFLFNGGDHQMLHMAPVAAELARQGTCSITLFVPSPKDGEHLARVLALLDAPLAIRHLPTPSWLKLLAAVYRSERHKVPSLLAGWSLLRVLDVLVTAERTSTILARLPGQAPMLIHIPHGAGDRARGFEKRIRLFDHVIVAGPKDRDRMLAERLVTPESCSVSGYVKLSTMLRLRSAAPAAPLFPNDRPVVLYNPHFETGLSSFRAFGGAVADATRSLSGHNFIIAPHVRLRDSLSGDERARLQGLAVRDRVIVDLGSERSTDMTYTMAADIYVGDVSSQVYEYLHVPKPCVFLNASGGDQTGDANFACWQFGEVVVRPVDVSSAIERAPALHARFAEKQAAGVRDAVGPVDECAAGRAASVIGSLALDRTGRRVAASV